MALKGRNTDRIAGEMHLRILSKMEKRGEISKMRHLEAWKKEQEERRRKK